MAGSRTSWVFLATGAAAAALWAACQSPEDDTQTEGPSDLGQATLDDAGPEVILPALATYRATLMDLSDAVDAWSDGGDRAAVHDVFADAMLAWQRADVHRVPPAEGVDPIELRDNQYSWPVVNACRVDQVTAAGDYADPSVLLVNARGLDALEHLLYADSDTICPRQVPPNSDGAWATFDDDALDAARSAYAVAIVEQLESDLAAYEAAWAEPSIPSLQDLMDGVFALETAIKDERLGPPLGIVDCVGETCVDRAEGRPESASMQWVIENLHGFRDLFTGGQGTGFDDLLADIGEQQVSDDLLALTDQAIAEASALESNVQAAILADRPATETLYETVDAIDEILRADVVPLLMLQLPAEVGGDVD